jgi:hypothetical protein
VLQVDEPGQCAAERATRRPPSAFGDLVEGDRVQARIMMGVVVRLERS